MKRTFIRIVLAGILLLYAASASGEIYRWVDEKGVTHFSDRKPDNSGVVPVAFINGHKVIGCNENEFIDLLSVRH